jgi:GNAT superfamily N-acetyltransferase
VILQNVEIAQAAASEFSAIWPFLEPVLQEGRVFALPRDLTFERAQGYWFAADHRVFVAKVGRRIVGSYFIRPNAGGGGAHVANAGFVTDERARGQGIGRAMGQHALTQAKTLGFSAMQFNLVVSDNVSAVHLWQSLGLEVVGTLPGAFIRPDGRACDVYVMFRTL